MTSRKGRIARTIGRLTAILFGIVLLVGGAAWYKLFREVPQQLANGSPEEYFKYGSIGTENQEGLPYYVWLVLPRMFPEYLPKDSEGTPRTGGYTAFGFGWEQGRETPVGFSIKTIGFPRVGINCAACHSTTYRTSQDALAVVVPTGPAQCADPQAYVRFLSDCASDPRFNAENLLDEISYNTKLSLIDKLLYRYVIIPQTRKALLDQKDRFAWTDVRPRWGPGRIDPFNPVKFHQLALPVDDTIGNSDMMPLWNMAGRRGHSLHWDGLNSDLTEVILSGAIGDGATNKSLPVQKLKELEEYLLTAAPPRYPLSESVDSELALRGSDIFREHCRDCHAVGGRRTGSVIPLAEIGTDAHRAKMWVKPAVESYHHYSDGYPWDFRHFVDVDGYVAVPLDGLWLRAPYLHNGSVPTIEALLEKSSERPRSFYRGYDVVDKSSLGFVHEDKDLAAKRFGYLYDVDKKGNNNAGHEGPQFGTDLAEEDKRALVEYLKTL